MSEPVVSREAIAKHADRAAKDFAQSGAKPMNPFPSETEAAAAWRACYERFLLLHSAPEAEGSA
jgi:hypothetical protein